MRAVCQHGHVFAADVTTEVTGFANRIHSPPDREPAPFICPHAFTPSSSCTSVLSAHNEGVGSPLVRLRWCCWCHEHVDQRVQHPVPTDEEQNLTLSTERRQWWEERCEGPETCRNSTFLPLAPFRLRKPSSTASPTDAEWHYMRQLKSQPGNCLKRNSTEGRTPREQNSKYHLFELVNTIIEGLLEHFAAPVAASKINWA